MQSSLSKINTSLEAHNLVKDPVKLLSLLYSKYGDTDEDFYILHINQILYKKHSHFNLIYKENQFSDIFTEFLRRFYKKDETISRIPKLYEYYKNYHKFYCKPLWRNFYISKLMHNFEDNKAEIFYKNNYTQSWNNKEKSNNDTWQKSSLSSSDNITNNKIIFDKKTKLLLESSKFKLNNQKNKPLNINLSKILNNNSNFNDSMTFFSKRSKDSFLKEVRNYFLNDNNINKGLLRENNSRNNIQKIKKNKKLKNTSSHRSSSKKIKKMKTPKSKKKSPASFQICHHIHLIKYNINNNNIALQNLNNNNNNFKTPMYVLSRKNSNSKSKKKRNHHSKIKNILFSPIANNYFNNFTKKFHQSHNKYNNIYLSTNKNKNHRNRTHNNSINDTFKKSINNNNTNVNNFVNYSHYQNLANNITYNKFYSSSNSHHNSVKTTCNKSKTNTNTNKIQKSKQFIIEINKNNVPQHKKNKTFDFINKKSSDLKKNISNINLLGIKNSPFFSNGLPIKNTKLIKNNKNNLHNVTRNKLQNTNSNKRVDKSRGNSFQKNTKSMISVCDGSTKKFSFINNKIKKEGRNVINILNNNVNKTTNTKNSNNCNLTTNNLNKKVTKILIKNNRICNNSNINNNISNKKIHNQSLHKKNNISYTNNNFNINFNNIIFCSPRNTNQNLQHSTTTNITTNNNQNTNVNMLSDSNNTCVQNSSTNISNTVKINNSNKNIKSKKNFNSIYEASRNKNKISTDSRTQSQANSLIKNIKYNYNKTNETKIFYNKKNNSNNIYFIDDKKHKNINEFQTNKYFKYNKKLNNSKKINNDNNKFSASHKKQIGYLSNKMLNNNLKNNKNMSHEIFNKNIKKCGSSSIKINQGTIYNNVRNCGNYNVNINKINNTTKNNTEK